jgi:hypothetical protein
MSARAYWAKAAIDGRGEPPARWFPSPARSAPLEAQDACPTPWHPGAHIHVDLVQRQPLPYTPPLQLAALGLNRQVLVVLADAHVPNHHGLFPSRRLVCTARDDRLSMTHLSTIISTLTVRLPLWGRQLHRVYAHAAPLPPRRREENAWRPRCEPPHDALVKALFSVFCRQWWGSSTRLHIWRSTYRVAGLLTVRVYSSMVGEVPTHRPTRAYRMWERGQQRSTCRWSLGGLAAGGSLGGAPAVPEFRGGLGGGRGPVLGDHLQTCHRRHHGARPGAGRVLLTGVNRRLCICTPP